VTAKDSAKKELLDKIKEISKENNDEPLYSSFVRWVCENILDITNESDIQDAVSLGGKNDWGVDFFVHNDVGDTDDQYICWGQVKFSESFDYSVVRDEMVTFRESLGYLEKCPETANTVFKEKSELFNQLGGRNAKIRKKMIFVVTGDLNVQANEILTRNEWKQAIDNQSGPKIEFEVITIDDILNELIRPPTSTFTIKFDSHNIVRDDMTTQKQSIIGFVKAKELVKIVKDNPGMFGLNVRESLGKHTSTFEGMTKTLKDPNRKQQFWKFNNGVTATCKKFEKIDINPSEFVVEDFKVVNGRQTTYCLAENEGLIDETVFVGMTIHEARDDQERSDISEATNTQNPVKPVDLISNFDEINDLAIQCRHQFYNFYFERQTKGFKANNLLTKRVTTKRLLDKNKTARAYMAYSIDPNDAMIPDKRLFARKTYDYYNKVFQNREIKDLIVPHIFMQMLNGLDSKWNIAKLKGDSTHKRDREILHKEIVKYFILDLIGTSMRELSLEVRTQVEKKIIEIMEGLNAKDKLPNNFIEIAEHAYGYFTSLFNHRRDVSWPEELYDKINQPGYDPTADENKNDVPTGFDIMTKLKKRGKLIRSNLTEERLALINQGNKDPIRDALLSLVPDLI